MAKAAKPVPEGFHSLTPHLILDNAAQTIDWYKEALGAQEVSRSLGPDGKIMHAEITIGGSRVMVADECSASGSQSPQALNGTACGVFLYLEDVDSTFKQAIKAGAKETMPVQDMFWGDRFGRLTDPFGHKWMLATHIEDVTPQEMEKRTAALASK